MKYHPLCRVLANPTRIPFLRCSFVLTWAGLVMVSSAIGAQPKNVLFIAVDDLRPELGCYGAEPIQSPHIDRLASEGLLFQRAYCQQAVCSPSRTSLMTGCRPDTTRVWDLDTNFRDTIPEVVTLSEHFIRQGYVARGMGKIYHGGLNDARSWSIPWVSSGPVSEPRAPRVGGYYTPENIQLLEAETKAMAAKRKAFAKSLGRRMTHSEGRQFRVRGPAWEAPDIDDAQTSDGATARLAVRTMKELKARETPFFLAVGFLKPHLPFVAPKRYWDLYDRETVGLAGNPFPPRGAPAWALSNSGELRNYRGIPGGREPIPDDLAVTLRHGYYACVSFCDAQVGLLLDALEELGLAENTIVILWGDHGWKLGEHGQWCKHTNYENDTRVPMILRVPGRTSGQKTDALVEFVDIYPTLCDLAGIPSPHHLEGLSFAPLVDDPGRPWKMAALSQYPRSTGGNRLMGYTLRTEHFRFVEWLPHGLSLASAPDGVVELYDHRHDPAENQNLAANPDQAARIRDYRALLRGGWKAALPKGP